MALLHSEVSEAFEAYRNGEEDRVVNGKPEGIASELADVLIRLLDTCERYSVDLEEITLKKIRYNASRGHRHGGKVV